MTSSARSFAELLDQAAARAPSNGVEDASRGLSYAELERAADSLAAQIAACGRLSVAALLLPRSLDFVTALAAASRVAPTVLILNPALPKTQLASVIEAGVPDIILSSPEWCDAVRTASKAPSLFALEGVRLVALRPGPGAGERREEPQEPRAVLYTSGTTGSPKGVLHLQSRLIANAAAVAEHLTLDASDVALIGLPLHHSYGLNHLLAHVSAGARVLLSAESPVAGLFGPASWWSRVTNIPLVPTTLRLFLGWLRASRVELPRLRFMMSAAGPLPQPLVDEFLGQLRDVPLFNNYGQTEAGPRVTVARMEPGSAAGFVGGPLAGVALRIAGEGGRLTAPGEAGEVLVRTPNAMVGYHDDPVETARVLAGGWLHTGDRGRLDADGLHLTGRLSDVVHCGGVRVTALEIEEALLSHPAVAEAAVVAVPHVALGEVAKAFIVPVSASAASPRDLTFFCRRSLAPAKVPREFVFVQELPRTSSGKVMKSRLK